MAYSMFECPKLHNAKSLKLYPEECDHHVSFRHKNLPPDFELTVERYTKRTPLEDRPNYSIQPQTSTHKKCPIYVHTYAKIQQNEGDFIPKKHKKSKSKQKLVIQKLEETYWANWKPEKSNNVKKSKSPTDSTVKSVKSPEIQVIKSAPDRRRKIQVYPDPEKPNPIKGNKIEKEHKIESQHKVQTISSRSQEIQTEDIPTPPSPIEEEKEETTPPIVEVTEEPKQETPSEVVEDNKFLKHTDSFILNVKKQNEEKEHFDQPKCIRLYRKPGKMTSKNYIKGGSYPLKSCLRKESTFTRTTVKHTRPGSPLIISSSYSSKNRYGKAFRH